MSMKPELMIQKTTPMVGARNHARYYELKLGHKTERISMVAASCCRQILAPITFVGYCNTKLIEGWVEFFSQARTVTGPDCADGQREFS